MWYALCAPGVSPNTCNSLAKKNNKTWCIFLRKPYRDMHTFTKPPKNVNVAPSQHSPLPPRPCPLPFPRPLPLRLPLPFSLSPRPPPLAHLPPSFSSSSLTAHPMLFHVEYTMRRKGKLCRGWWTTTRRVRPGFMATPAAPCTKEPQLPLRGGTAPCALPCACPLFRWCGSSPETMELLLVRKYCF